MANSCRYLKHATDIDFIQLGDDLFFAAISGYDLLLGINGALKKTLKLSDDYEYVKFAFGENSKIFLCGHDHKSLQKESAEGNYIKLGLLNLEMSSLEEQFLGDVKAIGIASPDLSTISVITTEKIIHFDEHLKQKYNVPLEENKYDHNIRMVTEKNRGFAYYHPSSELFEHDILKGEVISKTLVRDRSVIQPFFTIDGERGLLHKNGIIEMRNNEWVDTYEVDDLKKNVNFIKQLTKNDHLISSSSGQVEEYRPSNSGRFIIQD